MDAFLTGGHLSAGALFQRSEKLIERGHDFSGFAIIGGAENQLTGPFHIGFAFDRIVAFGVFVDALDGVHGLGFQSDQRVGKLIGFLHQG